MANDAGINVQINNDYSINYQQRYWIVFLVCNIYVFLLPSLSWYFEQQRIHTAITLKIISWLTVRHIIKGFDSKDKENNISRIISRDDIHDQPPFFFSSCWHVWLSSLENQMNHVNRVFKCLFSVAKSWIAWCKCLPLPISWCLLRLFTTLETSCNDNISLEINLNHSSSWYSTLFLKWQFSITLFDGLFIDIWNHACMTEQHANYMYPLYNTSGFTG